MNRLTRVPIAGGAYIASFAMGAPPRAGRARVASPFGDEIEWRRALKLAVQGGALPHVGGLSQAPQGARRSAAFAHTRSLNLGWLESAVGAGRHPGAGGRRI